MRDATKLLTEECASGATFDGALARLREEGASPMQAIKAIREVRGVTLAQAKELLSQSAAWRLENEAAAMLYEELLASLSRGEES